MFRDRTNLFLSYRRTIPRDTPGNLPIKRTRFQDFPDEEENEGLIISSRKEPSNGPDQTKSIPLKPLVPSIFDIAKDLDVLLAAIAKSVDDLNAMYKKLIIGDKATRHRLELDIEELNYQILRKFEQCYVLVKKFDYLSKNYDKLGLNYTTLDLEILVNYKKNYANKIQESSLKFRNLQNNYMKFLKDDDDEFNEEDLLMSDLPVDEKPEFEGSRQQQSQTQQQINHGDSQFLHQREREISKLAHGILEILTIFKEMESMVIEQGTMLDRIDYNLTTTVQELKSADKELIKAHHYQKRTTKCKIIFFLCLCVFALLMILMLRPGSSTKKVIVEKPAPTPDRPTIDKPENEVTDPDAGSRFI
ncbi:T-SNARE affecting a late Golgi compartment protein 2 [Candida viswanathii]|uniref:t-SNARE affecting a late Golgi compartment protein 2 n=1 Tax=Candida viswanathii TaxID=5486 RepID=A0A367YNT6_9ASCO|nr:T-SNARE affecting a late Golgi compartment protein 2 [Candida viswanathii]